MKVEVFMEGAFTEEEEVTDEIDSRITVMPIEGG
jgi:hypothetical protein